MDGTSWAFPYLPILYRTWPLLKSESERKPLIVTFEAFKTG